MRKVWRRARSLVPQGGGGDGFYFLSSRTDLSVAEDASKGLASVATYRAAV
ncbi:MAG: hypothetical protein ACMG6S_04885 [Byssovorax sp.]